MTPNINPPEPVKTKDHATQEEKRELRNKVQQKYKQYNRGAKGWSTIQLTLLYISAVASAGAALILKSDFLKGTTYQTDWAALLAILAAILTIITAVGGFNRKWRVNRFSKRDAELLELELIKTEVNPDVIRKRLEEIIRKHDAGIAGPDK